MSTSNRTAISLLVATTLVVSASTLGAFSYEDSLLQWNYHLNRSAKFIGQKEYELAEAESLKALEESRRVSDNGKDFFYERHALRSLAEVYRLQGKYQQALDTLKLRHQLRADSLVDELIDEAKIYESAGQYENQEACLKKAVQLECLPSGNYSRSLLVQFYRKQKRPHEAEKLLIVMVSMKQPMSFLEYVRAGYCEQLGDLQRERGDLDAAYESYKFGYSLLEIDDERPNFLIDEDFWKRFCDRYIQFLKMTHRYKEAEQVRSVARKLSVKSSPGKYEQPILIAPQNYAD
jgi:tetratricopeptide (TPR) repeat protein